MASRQARDFIPFPQLGCTEGMGRGPEEGLKTAGMELWSLR
jgi:hypothetical protein